VSYLAPVSKLEAVCRGASPGIFEDMFPDGGFTLLFRVDRVIIEKNARHCW